LYCSSPKQTTTLAGIIKPSAIFTPGTLLRALAHEYIFIFVWNKNVFIASLFVAVGRRLRYALSEYEMRLLIWFCIGYARNKELKTFPQIVKEDG
jgi:hypothetical protein